VGARSKSLAKLALLIALAGGAFVIIRGTEFGQSLDRELRELIATVDPTAARLLYMLVYIVWSLLFLPGVLLSFVGAVLFGVWEGTLYTWIGATIGAVLAFGLARALGRGLFDQLASGKLRVVDEWLREHGVMGLFIVRLAPLFPFNYVNLACGLTSIRLRDYVLATAVGIVPGTFVYQYLFATFGEKVLTEGFEWGDLATVDFLLPMGLFILFVLTGGWIARAMRRGAGDDATKDHSSD
jgi:uncharacterized membrane protein YdjX (TVP38/TMEM64 family)